MTEIFLESSFFKTERASRLPTPAEVRGINHASGNIRGKNFNRPPPVMIPSLDLVIKYGADVTVTEAQTLMMIRNFLKDHVPVPGVFGWTGDENQVFIYMSLIEGETLQESWCNMNENERLSVCEELRCMAKAWRSLKQDGQGQYVGGLARQPLNEIFLLSHPELAKPFEGSGAVQKFQDTCGIEINGEVPIVLLTTILSHQT